MGHGLMRTMQMMEQMLSAIDYAHLHGTKAVYDGEYTFEKHRNRETTDGVPIRPLL